MNVVVCYEVKGEKYLQFIGSGLKGTNKYIVKNSVFLTVENPTDGFQIGSKDLEYSFSNYKGFLSASENSGFCDKKVNMQNINDRFKYEDNNSNVCETQGLFGKKLSIDGYNLQFGGTKQQKLIFKLKNSGDSLVYTTSYKNEQFILSYSDSQNGLVLLKSNKSVKNDIQFYTEDELLFENLIRLNLPPYYYNGDRIITPDKVN